METTFNKQETIKLIEEYYRRLEGKEVKASITAKEACFGLYESKGCQTTVTVTESMEIAGIRKDVKTELGKEDLLTKLRALFSLYEFDLKGFDYEDGLSSRCEGFGMDEHVVSKPYFNGITVRVEKQKQQNLGMYYR